MIGYHALHDSHATRFRDAGSLTTQSIYLSEYLRLGRGVRVEHAKLDRRLCVLKNKLAEAQASRLP
eukprot:scaffold52528_cov48-Phaeocystis_antarctica.AAC.1